MVTSAPTASRGHGRRAQRAARRRLLAQHTPGDACCRCGEPMLDDPADLDADHFGVPLALDPDGEPDALAHGRCNRYAGRVLQLLMGGHVPPRHVDPVLDVVRRQVLGQVEGLDLAAAAAAAAGGPDTRTSREW